MCSCCYGPEDLPSLYWKDRKIKHDNYSYILFKNADNGSGAVTKNDWIEDYTCIMWGGMGLDKLKEILDLLQEQLGEAYYIEFPESEYYTAVIRTYL